MLAILILVLAALWVFGYVNFTGIRLPDMTLFAINGQPVTLINLLILFLVMGAVTILPTPFREIAGFLLILWILAVIGIISIAGIGLPSILLLAIIVGLIASLFTHRRAY